MILMNDTDGPISQEFDLQESLDFIIRIYFKFKKNVLICILPHLKIF